MTGKVAATFEIDSELYGRIQRLASEKNCTPSEVFEELCREVVRQYEAVNGALFDKYLQETMTAYERLRKKKEQHNIPDQVFDHMLSELMTQYEKSMDNVRKKR